MRLIDIMKKFTDVLPPEDVDMIICNITDDPDDREFERARFFKKGSLLKHEYRSKGSDESLLFDLWTSCPQVSDKSIPFSIAISSRMSFLLP